MDEDFEDLAVNLKPDRIGRPGQIASGLKQMRLLKRNLRSELRNRLGGSKGASWKRKAKITLGGGGR